MGVLLISVFITYIRLSKPFRASLTGADGALDDSSKACRHPDTRLLASLDDSFCLA